VTLSAGLRVRENVLGLKTSRTSSIEIAGDLTKMKEHIAELLDRKGYANLSEGELASLKLHGRNCEKCQNSFDAARVAMLLLRSQTAAEFSPSPYFAAKVMASLRERRATVSVIDAFRRWWQASAAVVAIMLVTLASVIGLTILAPSAGAEQASSFNLYSADTVILNQRSARDVTTEQALQVIYEDGDNK
jgi:hypothetical protein